MRYLLAFATVALAAVLVTSCGQAAPTEDLVTFAVGGTDRPFEGLCEVAVAMKTHEDGEEGGCGGGHEEEPSGGPPIARHYEVSGSCQLTHLGRVELKGRLNVTGPFGMGGGHDGGGHEAGAEAESGEGGHGGPGLAVRGRLVFVAANGDQLVGRYVPVAAAFTRAASQNGGTLDFTSTFKAGESCEGHDGGGGHAVLPMAEDGHDGGHDEPVSTGRFAGAMGEAGLAGSLLITKDPKQGRGELRVSGLLSY